MGCDYQGYLVNKNDVYKYDYDEWWNNKPVFPKVDNRDAEDYTPYLGNGSLIWKLFDYCNLNKITEHDGWIVVEINQQNIDILIDTCKSILIESLDINNKDDFENSKLTKFFWEYTEGIPEDLCAMYRRLQYVKEVLIKYPQHSFVVNINF